MIFVEKHICWNTDARYQELLEKKSSLAVVGLGYVGLPLAVAFARHFSVIGLDINREKIAQYRSGLDPTDEVGDEAIQSCSVQFTHDEKRLREASFIVVAVPTPIHGDNTPDLTPVKSASELVGRNITPGTVVVFESTVYPGVTEEICAPVIEAASGLVCGRDFFVGYSPERINPGDHVHRLETITKIISASEPEVLELLAHVYGSVIRPREEGGGGIFRAGSIRVAEAAKLLENSQRDVNIAFMNEIALGLHRMGIDTAQVLQAMNTKWNALGFTPGLVGGHCIGVDPYYFAYETEKLGFHSSIITTARRINDDLPVTVAQEIVKEMIRAEQNPSQLKIYMLGMTFKGNCPDLRNTKAKNVKQELENYGLRVEISDPVADPQELEAEFRQTPVELEKIRDADCLIFAADHKAYRQLAPARVSAMLRRDGCRLVADIRSIFRREELENEGCRYWNL